MQPKSDPSIAIGVTEIIKTLVSHPDHGVKATEIPGLVKDIFRAFQEASQVSSEAIAAATPALAAPTPAPDKAEEPAAEEVTAAETSSTETPAAESSVEEVADTEKSASATPAKTKAKSRSQARTGTQAAAPTSAEAPAGAVSETEAPATGSSAKKSGSKKKTGKSAAAEEAVVTEAVAAAPAEEASTDPQSALDAKFGEKLSRTPWKEMDPEAAIQGGQIICLLDGLPRKMLHRHLKARYSMSPEEYRAWFHLRDDYPMTAPGYSKEKSDYAKEVGLGTSQFSGKSKAAEAEASSAKETPAAPATPKTSRRSRKGSKQGAAERQRTNA